MAFDTPRYSLRQRVLVDFGYGAVGTTTSSTDTTSLLDTSRVERNDYWQGADALIRTGSDANVGVNRRVTDSISGDLTTVAFPANIATGVEYELWDWYNLAQVNNAIDEAIRRAMARHWMLMMWDGLVIVANQYDYALPTPIPSQTITIDAGSDVNTLRDSVLTQANDYFNGARVVALTGTAANLGAVRNVTDFLAATDDLQLDIDLPAAPSAGDTYNLVRPKFDYIYYVEYIPSGATLPIPVPDRDWSIVWRGNPFIRFNAQTMPSVGSTVRIYGYRKPLVPSHDQHPIEVPDDYALNFVHWQLLRSRPRKADYQLDNVELMKREAWDMAEKALIKDAIKKMAGAKRV